MKTSIALTLIIIAAVFSFVSGYSIGTHSDQAVDYRRAGQAGSANVATAQAAVNSREPAAPAAGYGSPRGEASSGYGTPSPGYGQ